MASDLGASSPSTTCSIVTIAEGEGEAQTDGDPRRDTADQRLQQMFERRLGERAEPDARDGDAELARGEIGVDVLHRVQRRPGAGLAGLVELDHLTRAHARDRELSRHEERVRGRPAGRPR